MGKPLRVLLIEDDENDALLLENELRRGGFDLSYECVETEDTLLAILRERVWDIVLCDYSMPSFNGLRALEVLKESGLDLPVIIVSGVIGEETAVSCMKQGARDYIMKGNLSRLAPAVERELADALSRQERKKMESQLQQAQKMEAVGTLAGGVAHDFNNLLMTIQGHASAMLLKTDPSDPRYEPLQTIVEQVESGANLTRQLLCFARMGHYDVKPLDVNNILQQSSVLFGRTKKEIVIHRRLARDLWTVAADSGQLEQVFMNIYVNAWQAMANGGDLSLETANVTISEAPDPLPQMRPGRYVKVIVRDSGTGMSKETMGRIFEPFFTTKGKGLGTGLGLSMVYRIVKGHDGYIHVSSEEGKGTTVTIYLPATDHVVSEEVEKPQEELVRGSGTILLIDDEPGIIDAMGEVMQILGYDLLTAQNGSEALKLYQDHGARIDLVILDMIMPGMSGREVFDRLQEMNPRVKVILSSGYSQDGKVTEVMARGCQAFIQKPYRIANLSKIIGELTDKAEKR